MRKIQGIFSPISKAVRLQEHYYTVVDRSVGHTNITGTPKIPTPDSIKRKRPHAAEKSWLADVSRHPLFLTIVGFVLTSIIGGSLTYWFSSLSQEHQIEETTRNSAISAVGDIAELVSERRQRASLLIREIERGAAQKEAEALKAAYDEAFVRWNVKLPSAILRVKAGLGSKYPLFVDRYIDGLVNLNFLLAGANTDTPVIARMPKKTD
jgi:hypothetical protein